MWRKKEIRILVDKSIKQLILTIRIDHRLTSQHFVWTNRKEMINNRIQLSKCLLSSAMSSGNIRQFEIYYAWQSLCCQIYLINSVKDVFSWWRCFIFLFSYFLTFELLHQFRIHILFSAFIFFINTFFFLFDLSEKYNRSGEYSFISHNIE